MNTLLASLLVFNNIDKLKCLHDLVIGICWSMNELVVVKIHLGQKLELIVQVFAIHQFPFLSQTYRSQFDKVQVCVLWDFINCDTLGVILQGDDVDEHSKPWIWIHTSIILPFL